MLFMVFVIPHGGVIIEDPIVTTIDIDVNTDTLGELSYTDTLPEVLDGAEVLGYYENDNTIITIYKLRMYDSDIFVADALVSDATDILNAFAYDTFGGRNVADQVSDMAEDKNAIFAINADYASHYNEGIVIRNGTILRDTISSRTDVVLWVDGTITIFDESDTSAQALLESGAWQVWSFGPALVQDNECVSSVNDGVSRDAVNNPRTAMGIVSSNHFMFVCVDGRTDTSQGVDIEALADIMYQLNCSDAYNFDGGGSSTMWFNGEIINNPSSGYERKVGDCVYILT